ncbi:MAG: HEAT repeat domain-containing protein [Pirellulales bacterium]|nr:HEAT repeat domain-containing protein [Pirellulales bacterium]
MSEGAKAAVHTYLASATDFTTLTERDHSHELAKYGKDIIPALEDSFESVSPIQRVLTAWMLLRLGELKAGWVSQEAMSRCRDFLETSMSTSDADLRLWTCTVLQHGHAPQSMVESLTRTLADGPDDVRVFVAAALVGTGEGNQTAMSVLANALVGDHEIHSAIAASAFVRLGIRRAEAVKQLVATLRTNLFGRPIPVLQILGEIGPAALSAAPAVIELVGNTSLSPLDRGYAALTLGSIRRGTGKGNKILERALHSEHWQIVQGSAEGLALVGPATSGVIRRLIELLSDDNEDLRRAAAIGLRAFGPSAVEAMSNMIGRLAVETSPKVLDELVGALSALGQSAVPSLVDIVRQGDMRTIASVVSALSWIARDHTEAVICATLMDTDEVVRKAGVMVVFDLQDQASAAAPILARLLDETVDDNHAAVLIAAISACGPSGAMALDSLINALIHRHGIASEWAENALRKIGREATRSLQSVLPRVEGEQKAKVNRLLSSLDGGKSDLLEQFAGIDLETIRTYVLVGSFLESAPSASSWPTILSALQKQFPENDAGIDLDISARTLSNRVGRLGDMLGLKLTDHAERTRGRLTKDGQRIWRSASEYLRVLAMSRQTGETA